MEKQDNKMPSTRFGKLMVSIHEMMKSFSEMITSFWGRRSNESQEKLFRSGSKDVVKTQLRGFNDALESITQELHALSQESRKNSP